MNLIFAFPMMVFHRVTDTLIEHGELFNLWPLVEVFTGIDWHNMSRIVGAAFLAVILGAIHRNSQRGSHSVGLQNHQLIRSSSSRLRHADKWTLQVGLLFAELPSKTTR